MFTFGMKEEETEVKGGDEQNRGWNHPEYEPPGCQFHGIDPSQSTLMNKTHRNSTGKTLSVRKIALTKLGLEQESRLHGMPHS